MLSMLNPQPQLYCRSDPADKARLVVVIDTEEEFDWSSPFSRSNTSVQAMRWIHRAQDIFDAYHITPVYVIDYAVASQAEGYRPLQEIQASGRALIGAHLHPWVNPPFTEPVNHRNSFPGNLPRAVESAKLQVLGDCIGEHFGSRPVIYKAGRYGVGPNTASILEEQGYEVDVSLCPHMDYSAEAGPNFTRSTVWPYWFGTQRALLELPLTIGFTGLLRHWGTALHGLASQTPLNRLHAVGVLARLGLLNKVWLSPEGYLTAEHITLVRTLHRAGVRIFSFAFHSPSVEPGHTPYVRSQHDLETFLACCRRFFEFFMGELGGQPSTPLELKEQLAMPCGMLQQEA
jgi:hypothetical protein